MATRSEFEAMLAVQFRATFNGPRTEENLFAKMADYAAKAAEALLGARFDPEPAVLGRLGVSFVGSAPELVEGVGGTGQRPLTEAELYEVIRRAEAVDEALKILEQPWGQGEAALEIVSQASRVLKGGPPKPEPEPVILWTWNDAGRPASQSATARQVGGVEKVDSYTPTQAVFELAERLGLSRRMEKP